MAENNSQTFNNGDEPRTAKVVQLRRGTSAQHNAFTGAIGEVTVDTTNKTLRVHDGQTPGGTLLARQSTLDAADYVIDYQMPSGANNNTWYRRYKSGWLETGTYFGPVPKGESRTFNFPFEFRSLHSYYVTALGTNSEVCWAGGATRTTTSCVIENNHTTNNNYIDVFVCGWMAS